MDYCVRCDSAVNASEVKSHICNPEKVDEVRVFLDFYDKVYGDTPALEVLSEMVEYYKEDLTPPVD